MERDRRITLHPSFDLQEEKNRVVGRMIPLYWLLDNTRGIPRRTIKQKQKDLQVEFDWCFSIGLNPIELAERARNILKEDGKRT